MGLSLKKVLKGVVKVGLPVVGSLVGGPVGGALGGALGGAVGSGRPKLGNIATGAALGGVGGGVLGGGAKTVAGTVAGAGGSGMTAGLGGFGIGSMIGSVGKYALAHPELVLGALGAVQASKDAGAARDMQGQALDLARQRYADAAPLRAIGLDRSINALEHPITPLQAVGGYQDMGNPYTSPYRSLPSGAENGASLLGAATGALNQPVAGAMPPSSMPVIGTLAGRASGKMNRAVRRAGGML